MITSVKGMRDLLPPETRVWNRLEETTRSRLLPLRLRRDPHARPRADGALREERRRGVGHRPQGDVLLHRPRRAARCRSGPRTRRAWRAPSSSTGCRRPGGVKKLYYVGPQYRYERPQKGRYREFRQIGAEVLGAADPATDAELLVMLFDLLGRLGFTGLSVSLNSVGSEESRPAYVEAAPRVPRSGTRRRWARTTGGGSARTRCASSTRRTARWPRSSPAAPRVLDHLDPASHAHHEELLALLDAERIPYRVEPRLVRGLDYYTRTVFEVTAAGARRAGRAPRRRAVRPARLRPRRPEDARHRLRHRRGPPRRRPPRGVPPGGDRGVRPGRPRRHRAVRPRRGARARGRAAARRSRRRPRPGREGPGRRAQGRLEAGAAAIAVLVGEQERESGIAIVKDLVERSQREVPLADLPRVLKGETP